MKMSQKSKIGYLLGVAVLLSGFALSPQALGRAVASDGQQEDEFTEAFIADLAASGFQVSQGYPALYTQQDCYERTYPILKNCFQANPAAPYIIPVVKSWPDEYVDPATENAFVETDPGYSASYRLDPREAIVIYGPMPPPGRYMGLQIWEFSEHEQWRPKDYDQWANTPDLPFPIQYLFSTIPPDDPKSHRIITLSSLGDVVNNVVMERQLQDDPFEKTLYFITTPSAATDQAVRESLQVQGVPDSHIFTEQIPREDDFGPIGPLGMGKNAIDFVTAFRYAVPDDTKAAESWRESLPLTVLRVRAPDSLGPVQRYRSLNFEPRTANSEDWLEDDLQDLVDAVCDSVSSEANLTSTDCVPSPPASSFFGELVRDYGWTGPYCRDVGMDCLADQQEAGLFFSSPRPTGSGQVYAVVATLATETDNAIYVGLSANDASINGGVPNATLLDTQLKGSAGVYASTVDNTSKFFVRYFTDNCDALEEVPGGLDSCTEISGMSTQGDPALQGMIIISLRNYIAPGTTSGPDAAELLTPRILTFTEQNRRLVTSWDSTPTLTNPSRKGRKR
ncbi:MAG: hypothetical protein ACSLFH_09115 [Desulfuromonadales bacterium]